jgi:monoamine oxidase
MVDQSALKAASLLHFQEEASSLDLNRRMKQLLLLKKKRDASLMATRQDDENDNHKKYSPADQIESSTSTEENGGSDKNKKLKTTSNAPAAAAAPAASDTAAATLRPVQKFQYVDDGNDNSKGGYRLLLATFAHVQAAANNNDNTLSKRIEEACQSGGDFVDDFYYQYEAVGTTLQTDETKRRADMGMHTSLGFDSFLSTTPLPTWHPLSKLETGQHKILSMLQLKTNSRGELLWDESAASKAAVNDTSKSDVFQGTHIPMEPRNRFRVGVIGGGIAGLSCATELLRLSERDNIDLEVVLLEARSRLGGRLHTDAETFRCSDGETPFKVDLGASWIHGIDHNPLAGLARQSGADFVTASEEVKMFTENAVQVDPEIDEQMGKLFDDLLDLAAEDIWEDVEERATATSNGSGDREAVVRWYSSGLGKKEKKEMPTASEVPRHRQSSDLSIDRAIGKAIAKHKRHDFSRLSKQQHRLLLWNTKNVEYALGANLNDLSMMFWDSDDRHAFEGDHVLLKQGYSQVVQHMVKGLEAKGNRFQCLTDFPVGTVAYAVKSTSMAYADPFKKVIDLSDTCSVTSQAGDRIFKFDFLVSTLPLGVLKDSIRDESTPGASKVTFQPSLPFVKQDAIQSVGFGLLNKCYLQFPSAFWRHGGVLERGQTLFGNASGLNPQYYMFNDIGLSLGAENNAPAILMTLISGKEAVELEQKTDIMVVDEVVCTLRKLFDESSVPEPIAFKITRWGEDEFSRGCYSFLPPGATDQDFQILQSPVNGNGDSLLLDKSETMRLFWAGEHTTALHPSMAHGALLSGIRAAKEVIDTITFSQAEATDDTDNLIPLAIFREKNPEAPLECSLCHRAGSRVREGSLLAFQRGARQMLVHNNCAEFSPEVEVSDGKWRDVIKAANRGAKMACQLCGENGATAGCTQERCFRSYHYSCAEDTGWRFERDGKEYYCDLHRQRYGDGGLLYGAKDGECDKISMHFYRTKNPTAEMICCFCGAHGLDKQRGKLLAFQQRSKRMLVHDKCARFTNIIDTLEESDSVEEFRGLFEAKSRSKRCTECGEAGATVVCTESSCDKHYHIPCCSRVGWNFERRGIDFRCEEHRVGAAMKVAESARSGGLFQHSLFAGPGPGTLQNGSSVTAQEKGPTIQSPENELQALSKMFAMNDQMNEKATENTSDPSYSSDEDDNDVMSQRFSILDLPLEDLESVLVQRESDRDPWGIGVSLVSREGNQNVLSVVKSSEEHDLAKGDTIVSVDGVKVGSTPVSNLSEVLAVMKQKVSLTFGLEPRKQSPQLNQYAKTRDMENGHL